MTHLKFAQCFLYGTHEGPTWDQCWLCPSGPNVLPIFARRGIAHEGPSLKPVALYTRGPHELAYLPTWAPCGVVCWDSNREQDPVV